jgi:hypothetical protein
MEFDGCFRTEEALRLKMAAGPAARQHLLRPMGPHLHGRHLHCRNRNLLALIDDS